ncbi:chemerin-like receptor 1 [Xyrauchen texanus]|uniref:chemerin-like receptor 1 n=1 Tax=Xyrauchen texanus TaxID=154827 RepID=UPI00224255E3|nr:chemerin-like receptor 1 [Xyrauchen texanus]XP_051966390.1 chemerin-like receptor 1 [Xyrauchen texanus]
MVKMNQTVSQSSMMESTNNTQVKTDPLMSITIFIHCIICVLGVVGNGLVIYVTGFRMKKTVNTIWFLNLAIADFIFTFFLIFNIIYECRNFDWPFGDVMCKLSSLVTVLNMFSSTFLLAAISLDRCLSTWLVVWARTKRTVLKVKIFCLFLWIVSVACSLPLAIFRQTVFDDKKQKTTCLNKYPNGLQTYKSLVMFRFVVGFLLPFILIFASYLAIGVRVQRLRNNNKLKPFRIILAVILAFFFCWLPFYILNFIDVWLHEIYSTNPSAELTSFKDLLDSIRLFIVSFAYFNSCLNPILYVFMCEDFKKKLRQSLVMVFENAFVEEHLTLLSHLQSKRNTHSHTGTEMTNSSALES